ncbi:MAG: ATP-binding cassette domain-containing protein [Spirochaetia bacterium]
MSAFQEWRTVEHPLQTFGLLSGLDRTALPGAIDWALARAGITEHRKRRIVHLSGGTVQRLRLAQAILHDPDILVLDEPLSGLDPASRYQVGTVVEVTVRPRTETDWDLLAAPPVTRVDAPEGSAASDGATARLHIDPSTDLADAISRIMKRLLGNSVPVRSIQHVQPSLEEVYLRLTEEPT